MKDSSDLKVDLGLGVTSPQGFRAGAAAAGVKQLTEKPDVAVLACDVPAHGAAVFTQNKVCAAPVAVSRKHIAKAARKMRGAVANSGNANACTGKQGLADAREMARLAGKRLGCSAEQMLVASTGVIGRMLPMDKVRAGIEKACAVLASGPQADAAFARAIMTTDTRPKQAGVRLAIAGRTVTVAGTTKGVGMIAPNMATTLAFLTTDAAAEAPVLARMLRRAADATYNCLTVDGHTSTNDTLLILASGLAMRGANGTAKPVSEKSADGKRLAAAILAVCDSLAGQIAADAEGGTKVIEVRVTGAASNAEARRAAAAIANSPLVKTAFFGQDPNWGRIVSAAGYAGISSGPETMRLTMGNVVIFDKGRPAAADEAALKAVMAAHDIAVHLDLGAGRGEARYLTCDFSYDYVKINAEYTT
ncbi:MAG: bifunctional glutamate N-acetyltransferase/amino-acid acetyltransferase ArgJ [Planctomycetes bacterium]|nr:bifunctional glutamate N-acetyltransferase/amino-acid acetyltransferase ArgJ [Planctomycetota bacterium]